MSAERVEDLLSIYLADRGTPRARTPEELCHGCTELLPELRRRITSAAFGEELLNDSGPGARISSDARDFPTRLGEYTVQKVIGRGGMGAVYLALDTRLDRKVALKVMLPGVAADPTARDRFVREARAAAAVHHDHVVPIFHVGEQDGLPYLVMPLLEGESLESRLLRGPLAPDEVARVGREAAAGLAAAHAKRLIHRDIKPANLWLEAPGGRVKLLDFGLARAADGADPLTQPGGILGTPAYMAPEQVDGRELDGRADLFSLGATLYQAATGVVPFRGATLTAVLRAVADHHPPAPVEVNPAVPAALSGLILCLLAKSADERPPSAQAVAAEFARLLSHMTDTLTPGATREFVSTEPRPRKRSRSLLVGGLVVLLLGAAAVWFATRPRGGNVVEVPAPAPDTPQPAPNPAPPVAVEPLRGSVDLLVYRIDRTGSDVLVPLSDPLALPLREGDHFKVVAEVNRPSYLYLFWVDETGAGVPVYPWKPGEWGTRPATEQAVSKLDIVAPGGHGFRVTGSAKGMETILMFARATPLDASDPKVQGWFAGLTPLPFRGEYARVWFENFDVLRRDPTRGFEIVGDVTQAEGPLGLQAVLEQRIGPKAEYARAVSFARIGKK